MKFVHINGRLSVKVQPFFIYFRRQQTVPEQRSSGRPATTTSPRVLKYYKRMFLLFVMVNACLASPMVDISSKSETIISSSGRTITMPCHVRNFKDIFNTPVNWIKVEDQETIINEGISINELFRDRYYVSYHETLNDLSISLTISNVSIRDNGTFKCMAQDANGGRSYVTHSVRIEDTFSTLAYIPSDLFSTLADIPSAKSMPNSMPKLMFSTVCLVLCSIVCLLGHN